MKASMIDCRVRSLRKRRPSTFGRTSLLVFRSFFVTIPLQPLLAHVTAIPFTHPKYRIERRPINSRTTRSRRGRASPLGCGGPVDVAGDRHGAAQHEESHSPRARAYFR